MRSSPSPGRDSRAPRAPRAPQLPTRSPSVPLLILLLALSCSWSQLLVSGIINDRDHDKDSPTHGNISLNLSSINDNHIAEHPAPSAPPSPSSSFAAVSFPVAGDRSPRPTLPGLQEAHRGFGMRLGCGLPPDLQHAQSNLHETKHAFFSLGTETTYSCVNGFQSVAGDETMVCLQSSSSQTGAAWSGHRLVCERKHSLPALRPPSPHLSLYSQPPLPAPLPPQPSPDCSLSRKRLSRKKERDLASVAVSSVSSALTAPTVGSKSEALFCEL